MRLDVSVLHVLYAVIFSSVVVVVGALAVLNVVMVRSCDSCDLKRLSTRFDVWCSRRCRCCPRVISTLDGNDRLFLWSSAELSEWCMRVDVIGRWTSRKCVPKLGFVLRQEGILWYES